MLTRAELVALHRSLRERRVLSVYIDGSATDPAVQRSWRVQLEQALKDIRRWLEDSPRDEREEYERCVQQLDTLTTNLSGSVGAPGWAAFITGDAVHHADRLPALTPTLAVWTNGASVSTYVRALQEQHPIVAIVTDARHGVLYRYSVGVLDRVDTIRAYHPVGHPEHMGAPARVGFHGGTRGTTGRDAAQRALLRGRDRMIREIAERAQDLAGVDGWIVVGGIKRVATRVRELIEIAMPHRVLQFDSLDVHSAESEVAEIARSGATALRERTDERRITEIIDAAGAHGLGSAGSTDTLHALEQSCVHDLYFTPRYLENHGADAERVVRTAFDGDAIVEEVSGPAADLLEANGGVAAGLRFRATAVNVEAGAMADA